MIYTLDEHRVQTAGDAYYVAPTANVIGRVVLGRDVSIWFGTIVRGDSNEIRIGDGSNVQDNAVVHVDDDAPATIGRNVTIGHGAVVHGCRIGDGSLIGIGATILSHAVIGAQCIVGAGALVTERKEFPDRSLVLGAPARRIRELTDAELAMLAESAGHYIELGKRYRRGLGAAGD